MTYNIYTPVSIGELPVFDYSSLYPGIWPPPDIKRTYLQIRKALEMELDEINRQLKNYDTG